jgi:hypothetical protein
MLTANLAELTFGACSFVLQNHYVRDWTDNSVMHLFASDLRLWWDHIVVLDLGARYGINTRALRNEGWGSKWPVLSSERSAGAHSPSSRHDSRLSAGGTLVYY